MTSFREVRGCQFYPSDEAEHSGHIVEGGQARLASATDRHRAIPQAPFCANPDSAQRDQIEEASNVLRSSRRPAPVQAHCVTSSRPTSMS